MSLNGMHAPMPNPVSSMQMISRHVATRTPFLKMKGMSSSLSVVITADNTPKWATYLQHNGRWRRGGERKSHKHAMQHSNCQFKPTNMTNKKHRRGHVVSFIHSFAACVTAAITPLSWHPGASLLQMSVQQLQPAAVSLPSQIHRA